MTFGRLLMIGIGFLTTSAEAAVKWAPGCAPKSAAIQIVTFTKSGARRAVVFTDYFLTYDKVFRAGADDMVVVNARLPSPTSDIGIADADDCAVGRSLDELDSRRVFEENRPTVLDEERAFGASARDGWVKAFRAFKARKSEGRSALEAQLRGVGAESATLSTAAATATGASASVKLCQARTSWIPTRHSWKSACYSYAFNYTAPDRLEVSRETRGGPTKDEFDAGSRRILNK